MTDREIVERDEPCSDDCCREELELDDNDNDDDGDDDDELADGESFDGGFGPGSYFSHAMRRND